MSLCVYGETETNRRMLLINRGGYQFVGAENARARARQNTKGVLINVRLNILPNVDDEEQLVEKETIMRVDTDPISFERFIQINLYARSKNKNKN